MRDLKHSGMLLCRRQRSIFSGLIVSAVAFSGCALTQKPKVIEVFLLDPRIPAIQAPVARLPRNTRIVVDEVESSSLLKGNSIIFGRDALTRGKYQYSEWETPAPLRLQKILANTLQSSNQFSRVATDEVIGLPAWKIKLELTDFYHDAQNVPGDVVIKINASLLTPKGVSLSVPKSFEARKPAHSFDAHGAVLSSNEVVAQLIPEIADWVIVEIGHYRKSK